MLFSSSRLLKSIPVVRPTSAPPIDPPPHEAYTTRLNPENNGGDTRKRPAAETERETDAELRFIRSAG